MSDCYFCCRDVVELLNDYFDGMLLGDVREEVECYFVLCVGCVVYL